MRLFSRTARRLPLACSLLIVWDCIGWTLSGLTVTPNPRLTSQYKCSWLSWSSDVLRCASRRFALVRTLLSRRTPLSLFACISANKDTPFDVLIYWQYGLGTPIGYRQKELKHYGSQQSATFIQNMNWLELELLLADQLKWMDPQQAQFKQT